MHPLVLNDTLAAVLFYASSAIWGMGELTLAIRTRVQAQGSDPQFLALFATTAASFLTAIRVAGHAGGGLPGGARWPVALGLGVFWAGVALRFWAIRALGRYFHFVIVVEEGQPVIDAGPYRLIRHPSYTGLLMAMLGLGIGLDNWLSLLICVVPPTVGFSLRLRSEERALLRELGEPYRDYMRRTRRLVPGVW